MTDILNFVITEAGRNAAINADATGFKLEITEIGFGTGNWSPDKTATALQAEFKRLDAGGGENPAPLYVHVTGYDQSSDVYQANEVCVYAGEVVLAIWSKGLQPDVDGPGKINSGDVGFAFDLLLTDVPPNSVIVGDANFSNPLATEYKPGIIKRASLDDVLDLLNDDALTTQTFKAWWNSVKGSLTDRIIGRELYFFTDDTPEPGFLSLDGSTIPNGVNDYAALAASGSRYITISGNDIILADASDVIRGKGSSDRAVGEFQGDAIRNIEGVVGAVYGEAAFTPSGAFYIDGAAGFFQASSSGFAWDISKYDASRVVPTAPENRVKSLTADIRIYYGES